MAMRIPSGENPFATDVAVGNPGKYSLVDPSLEGSPESKLSKEASEKLAKWQGELDRTQTLDAINQIEQQASDLELEYSQIKGENATNPADGKSLSETYGNKFKVASDDILNKIKRPEVRAKVSEFVQARNNKFYEGMNKYIIKEQSAYAAAVEADTGSRLYKKAVDPNPEISNDGIVGLRSLEASQTARTGLPSDHKLLGSAHLMQMGNICLTKNYEGAKAYLAANKAEMTPDQYRKAMDMVEDTRIEAAVDKHVKPFEKGINILASTADYELQKAEGIKKILAIKDPAVREKAKRSAAGVLREIEQQREFQINFLKASAIKPISDAIESGNTKDLRVPPNVLADLKAISPEEAAKIQKKVDQIIELGQPKTVPEIFDMLVEMSRTDIDGFNEEELQQYKLDLSPKDYKKLERIQQLSRSDKNLDKVFTKELTEMIAYNKETKNKVAILMAGKLALCDSVMKSKDGYVDEKERKKVIDSLFIKRGIVFKDSRWELINKAGSMNSFLIKEQGTQTPEQYTNSRNTLMDGLGKAHKQGDKDRTWDSLDKSQQDELNAIIRHGSYNVEAFNKAKKELVDEYNKQAREGKHPAIPTYGDVRAKVTYNIIHRNDNQKTPSVSGEKATPPKKNDPLPLSQSVVDGVKPRGMIEAGTIDITNPKPVQNEDGTVSTVRTITVGFTGADHKDYFALLPTVIDGKVVSNDEAIKHFQKTGQNLGKFKTEADASRYGVTLHNYHEQLVKGK